MYGVIMMMRIVADNIADDLYGQATQNEEIPAAPDSTTTGRRVRERARGAVDHGRILNHAVSPSRASVSTAPADRVGAAPKRLDMACRGDAGVQ